MFAIPSFGATSIINLKYSSTRLDDAVDRLSYVFTVFMLGVFCVIIGSKQHFGEPIQCMTPPEFQYGWNQYVEDYCFIQSTYTYPRNKTLTLQHNRPIPQYVNYYQWVPVIFITQALFFFLPNFIWQALQMQSGMDLQTIVCEAMKLRSVFGKERGEGAANLTAFIDSCLNCGSHMGQKKGRSCWDRLNLFSRINASTMYFIIKILYLINAVVQFFLINKVIGYGYALWGWEVLGQLMTNEATHDSTFFPRETMCDFVKREHGNLHNHSVQCVLMINMMNEKLFLILWFWFLFVAVCTLASLIYLLITLVLPYFRERRALQYLGAVDRSKCSSTNQLRDFWHHRLGIDGLLLLHFIEIQAGALVTRELAAGLWDQYFEQLAPPPSVCAYTPLIARGMKVDDCYSRSADEGFSETARMDDSTLKKRGAAMSISMDTLPKKGKESAC